MPRRLTLTLERPSPPIAFFAAYLMLYAAMVVVVPGRAHPIPLGFDVAYMAFRVTATYVLWRAGQASTDPAIARGWRFLAIGQVFAVAGNSTWIVSDLTGQDTSNWTYLAWTVPFTAFNISGYWSMMRTRDGRLVRSGDWVDAAILLVACATIAWYFIAARLVTTAFDDATGVFLFFYDTASNGASLLLAVTLWLRAPRGLAAGAMPRTVIGLLMLAAADLVIEKQLTLASYTAGSLIDVWYGAAILALALGAEAQRRDPSGAREHPTATDRADAVVFGALIASVLPLAVEVSTTQNLSSNPFAASGIGVIALMLLALWRQRLARLEIERLVTNRLRLEHELWQAQKLDSVGRLASGIAHDFNNILAAISSHAQMLRTGASRDAHAEAVEIEYATERASVLVRRLLDFSRSASPERKPVRVGPAVQSMHRMLRQLLGGDLDLRFDIGDGSATVHLADGQLEQVLLNLAINARDATPAGGTIVVATRRLVVHPRAALHRRGVSPGEWASIEVRDTGSGMDEVTQASVFQPFFTTKADQGGTGLGLATVAGIVQAASGHVLVESAVARGTSITVFLPLSPDELAPTEGAAPSITPVGGNPSFHATLLVVDDEAAIRSALARYLSRVGYRVVEADGAGEALAKLDEASWKVDLVLTDVRMPDMNGLELAAIVHQRRPELPVIFMTGQGDTPARGTDAVPPPQDTIAKPFDLQDVAEQVRTRILSAAAR